MSDQRRTPPFLSYNGADTYLFVSYAHADADWVYPELVPLNEAGLNVWFDEGIQTGTNWAGEVANFLLGSSGILFFVSEQSIASRNVINEIHLAVDSNLPVVIISRDNPKLPAGLKLLLGQQQAIIRKDLSLAGYQTKIMSAAANLLGKDNSAQAITGSNLHDRTSIAILTFQNNSPEDEDNYLALGLTEQLAYELQRLRLFSIIAPESTRNIKQSSDPLSAARDLNASFAITGGVRRAGENLRIDVRLTSSNSGMQIWANRFDVCNEDIFSLQDRVATEVVMAIEPEIILQESKRTNRVPTQDLAAWDLYIRGQAEFYHMTYEGLTKAKESWLQASKLDGEFVQPVAGLATIDLYLLLHHRGRFSDEKAEEIRKRGYDRATRAIAMDPSYFAGYTSLTGHLTNMNQYDEALQVAEECVLRCPSSVRVHSSYAFALFRAGRFSEALDQYDSAIRLSPRDPMLAEMINQQAACHFFSGNYPVALAKANRSIQLQEHYLWPHLFKTLSLSQLEKIEEAKQSLYELQTAVPDFSTESLKDIDPELKAVFAEGLRALGLDL